MSVFDPESFLNTSFEGKLDTHLVPIPEGQYDAIAEKIDARQMMNDKNEERYALNVLWTVQDHDGKVQAATKREKNTARQTIWLDMLPSGGLDMGAGANVQLGRLLEALGLNTGRKWTFGMIQGQAAKILVTHNPDKKDPETIYSEVKKVMPISG